MLRVSPACRSIRQEDEFILLNTDTGLYYGLNSTSSFVWDLLVSGVEGAGIVERYGPEFGVSTNSSSSDVQKVVSALQHYGLLVEV